MFVFTEHANPIKPLWSAALSFFPPVIFILVYNWTLVPNTITYSAQAVKDNLTVASIVFSHHPLLSCDFESLETLEIPVCSTPQGLTLLTWRNLHKLEITWNVKKKKKSKTSKSALFSSAFYQDLLKVMKVKHKYMLFYKYRN